MRCFEGLPEANIYHAADGKAETDDGLTLIAWCERRRHSTDALVPRARAEYQRRGRLITLLF